MMSVKWHKRYALSSPGVFLSVLLAAFVMLPAGELQAQQPATGQSQVTFTKDVAPIFQRACQNCHRPGSVAPMSLVSYEDSRPWARAIKRRVSNGEMPPWGIDRNVGIQEFKNNLSLTDREIATVVKWVDEGAQMGNPSDMPAPKQFVEDRPWFIGKPDLIIPMPKHRTAAVGVDEKLEWVVDTGLTEDRYFKAVETKPNPGGLRVVHHASLDIVEPGNSTDATRENYGMGGARSFLSEYALGKNADIFPEGTGRLIKAGSKINFNMHYYSVGEELESETAVGFVFYPKGYVPKHVVVTQHIGDNADLDIPAGTIGRVDGYAVLSQNAQLIMIQPHMHARGKRQCVEAILPQTTGQVSRGNGSRTERITLNCINFDMNWNLAYTYEDHAAPVLPKGTILHITNWYDNSPTNKFGLAAKNWVGNGPRSADIMSFQWHSFFYLTDEEYQQKVQERQRRATN